MGPDDSQRSNGKPTDGGVRRRNVLRVLDVLRTDGPSSQAALARRTKLSPATVNNIVRDLRSDGVAELQPVNGREFLVALASTRGAVAAVQVKVGYLRAALFDFGRSERYDSSIRLDSEQETGSGGPARVAGMVRSLMSQADIAPGGLTGLAVGMQAPIARSTGAITSWARQQLPGWKDVAVADSLADELGVPVVAENDANLAALAEWTWGAGRGTTEFLYAMCSTEVGGGLVLNGKIHRGGDGLAGEIGHMVLDGEGPVCFCGSRGCLTAFISERALLAALESAAGQPKQALHEIVEGALSGEPACRRVLYEAGRHLGRAFANAAKVLAPGVIAVGGVLGDAGSLVFDGLNSSAEMNSLRTVSPSIQFRSAEIGADATLFGGVAALLDELGQGLSALPEWMKQQPEQGRENIQK